MAVYPPRDDEYWDASMRIIPLSERRCGNCASYSFDGECRHVSPRVGAQRREWPEVMVNDWCGQFSLRRDLRATCGRADTDPPK